MQAEVVDVGATDNGGTETLSNHYLHNLCCASPRKRKVLIVWTSSLVVKTVYGAYNDIQTRKKVKMAFARPKNVVHQSHEVGKPELAHSASRSSFNSLNTLCVL